MTAASGITVGVALLIAGSALAVWDLHSTEARTVVVYTTPALRDLLETDIVPRFHDASGYAVSLVYVAAGEQYNRLRMSKGHHEASVFLHASPLYLEKGYDDGYFPGYELAQDASIPDNLKGRSVEGGRAWYAFAWSPLVEVYAPKLGGAPDLANLSVPFGFPHPQLSNNGVYAVLLFDQASPAAGQRALGLTRVQPANAQTNIGGVVDGSFDVTLGYEAVAAAYKGKGARIQYALPLIDGERVTTPVLSAASIVGPPTPGAQALVNFLFAAATQDHLSKFHFRPVVQAPLDAGAPGNPNSGNASGGGVRSGHASASPAMGGAESGTSTLDVQAARRIDYDWSRWQELDASLTRYVIT